MHRVEQENIFTTLYLSFPFDFAFSADSFHLFYFIYARDWNIVKKGASIVETYHFRDLQPKRITSVISLRNRLNSLCLKNKKIFETKNEKMCAYLLTTEMEK